MSPRTENVATTFSGPSEAIVTDVDAMAVANATEDLSNVLRLSIKLFLLDCFGHPRPHACRQAANRSDDQRNDVPEPSHQNDRRS